MDQTKNKKDKAKGWAIWVVVLLLLIGNVYQFTKPASNEVTTPQLGVGEEIILQEKVKPEKQKNQIAVAVPSSVMNDGGQVIMSAKNIGKEPIIISAYLGDSEVYRASRWLEQGEKINYVINIGNHNEVKTLIEGKSAEKFFVTSKIN